MLSVNAELIQLYWDIGRIIAARQQQEGWGAAVIPRLARELKNELPEEKGFSERNIKSMLAFYREYPDPSVIVQQPVAQLPSSKILPQVAAKLKTAEKVPQPTAQMAVDRIVQQAVAQLPTSLLWSIPWGHHVLLLLKVKELSPRLWYMQQTLKDPYIFDFLTLQEPFHERELETNLLHQLERFLLELGQGFAFVDRQYYLKVGDREFYIDLLFYHLKLRCFVVTLVNGFAFSPRQWKRHGLPIVRIQNLNHPDAPFDYCPSSVLNSTEPSTSLETHRAIASTRRIERSPVSTILPCDVLR